MMRSALNSVDRPSRWGIDRNVQLAFIIAAVLGFASACASAGGFYVTVNSHGDRLARLEAANLASAESLRLMQIDTARISERVGILVEHQQHEDHPRQ